MYVLLVLLVVAYIAVPVLLISGWVTWARHPDATPSSALPLISLAISAASGLLAAGTVIHATTMGGFRFYDPTLMRIFRWGLLLSLIASALSLAGIRKPSALRWHAIGSSLGMFLMWFIWAGME